MPEAPGPQPSLCFTWKTEGLLTVCDTVTPPSSGREGGERTSGQLLCGGAPPLSPKTHPDPHPHQLFPEDQVSFILTPTWAQTDSRASPPPPWHSVWPRARTPSPPAWHSGCCLRALTIVLCGLKHPTVCPHPTPAPVRASLQPRPEPGSGPGLAEEAPWAPTGLGTAPMPHAQTQSQGGCARGRRPGSRPRYQPHPHPPCHWAPPPCNRSNRPRLPPHCYSNGRRRSCWEEGGLLGGQAGRGAPGYGQGAQVPCPLHPTRGPQGGQTPVP